MASSRKKKKPSTNNPLNAIAPTATVAPSTTIIAPTPKAPDTTNNTTTALVTTALSSTASALVTASTYLGKTTYSACAATYEYLKKDPVSDLNFDPIEEKNGRDKTIYKGNVTASLALPEGPPKQTTQSTKNKVEPTSPSYLTTAASYVSAAAAYLYPYKSSTDTACTPTANQAATTDSTTVLDTVTPVPTQMAALERQCKQLLGTRKIEELTPAEAIILDDLTLKKVELVAPQIKEHAARRTDIFFYLLVAVYKQYVAVRKEPKANLQHGIGSGEMGTHACHSSLFPNPEFDPMRTKLSWLFQNEEPFTISNRWIRHLLNITTELPSTVNLFDKHLEGLHGPSKFTKACLKLINATSKGQIDPHRAMNAYFKILDQFFTEFENDFIKKPNKIETPNAFKKIWEYQKAGTFNGAKKDSIEVDNDYIYLMLRLTPTEKVAVNYLPLPLLSRYYTRIQQELLQTDPVAPLKKENGAGIKSP